MRELIPIRSDRLPMRVQRQLSRELAVVQARGLIQAAEQVTKVQVIEEVTTSAMAATGRVSQFEDFLAAQTPRHALRYAHLADRGVLAMGAVIDETARKVL